MPLPELPPSSTGVLTLDNIWTAEDCFSLPPCHLPPAGGGLAHLSVRSDEGGLGWGVDVVFRGRTKGGGRIRPKGRAVKLRCTSYNLTVGGFEDEVCAEEASGGDLF